MSPTRKRDEIHNCLKTSLDILSNAAKISPVPGLEGIIGTITIIMAIVENTKHNKQACYDICDRISKFLERFHVELGPLEADRGTTMRVNALEISLANISKKLSDLTLQNALRRAINRASDSSLIEQLNKEVDTCINTFMLGTQLSTGMDVKLLVRNAARAQISDGLNTSGWCSDNRCLPGTRRNYIDQIWEWVRNQEGPALCWLSGIAGAGKTCISHEFAADLHAKLRPYSCFFFRQDDKAAARSAIRILAYGLSFVTGLRELITEALQRLNDPRNLLTMREEFITFIVNPLLEFTSICPLMTVVLVFDGVDNCPADIRPHFLSAVSAGLPRLPPSVKVYLSSRPETDIRQCLEALRPLEIPVTVGVGLDDGDIEKYMNYELKRISKTANVENMWSASDIERDAQVLAPKAGGLFQCARLISSLLVNNQAQPAQPRDMVARLLNFEMSSTPELNLDTLYAEALTIALRDVNLHPLYHQVVSTILSASRPLILPEIWHLLRVRPNDLDARSAIETLLANLERVFILRRDKDLRVTVGHPSFRDYVTSRVRCPQCWYIELPVYKIEARRTW